MFTFKSNKPVDERVTTAWFEHWGKFSGYKRSPYGDLSKTRGNVEGGEMDAGQVGRVSESRGQCTFWRVEHSPRGGEPQSPGGPPGCAYGRQTHLKLGHGTGPWMPLGRTAAEETGPRKTQVCLLLLSAASELTLEISLYRPALSFTS